MNNGMFVEMCAYVANRDMEKAKYSQDGTEGKPEAISTTVPSKTRTALGLAGLGRLVRPFLLTLFNTAPKKAVEEVETRLKV